MHLAKAKENPQRFVQKMHGVDDDLTVHLTITKARGRTLYGPPPQDIIGFISKQDYLQSIQQDLIKGQKKIVENPSYYILNLCRTLACLQDGLLLSKEDGERWACHNLKINQHLIRQALEVRQGKKVLFKPHELNFFYIKMMALIKEQAKRK